MRDTMYGVVGHDMKEPLTHIYSLSNLALTSNLPQEQQKEIMEKIRTMALNANYLARNLLEWAYVSRKGLQPDYQKIKVNQVIRAEIELYKIIAEEKKIKILSSFNQEFVINTDENMFRIIIRNLINNAVKYSKTNSIISVETDKNKDSLQISIKDKGTGIDIELLNKLNKREPDNQLVSNGMGLYLTKTYVNFLGADLTIESKENSGTTAILIFP
jgi:signal transduction histidine kinase